MLRKTSGGALLLFWLTMNVLLWRAEFGGHVAASALPVATVWEKVLTAPDPSSLEIRQHGKKIGFCHWHTRVLQENQKKKNPDYQQEGRVDHISGYRIDLEGDLAFGARRERRPAWHFKFGMECATNHGWQQVSARVVQRPNTWQASASAKNETIQLLMDDGDGVWERILSFQELRRPEKLLAEIGGAWTLGLLAGSLSGQSFSNLSLGLVWEARNDSLSMGNARLRVYRVQARLFERYQAVIFISRAGEILRVELPEEIVLVNDAFTNF